MFLFLINAGVAKTKTSSVSKDILDTFKYEQTWPQGYKKNFMLNSAEHEISNADKSENIKKFRFFLAQISFECCFSCS